jgi:hypothetical protein
MATLCQVVLTFPLAYVMLSLGRRLKTGGK